MNEFLNVRGLGVIICYDKAGYWKRDKVVFPTGTEEQQALDIIQYLYDEGFLVDRRISYEIVTKGEDNEEEKG